jgi:hypothetical protein
LRLIVGELLPILISSEVVGDRSAWYVYAGERDFKRCDEELFDRVSKQESGTVWALLTQMLDAEDLQDKEMQDQRTVRWTH